MAPTDRDRWNRIQEVFNAACDQPIDRRAAFIARECERDPDLQWEVASLLAADSAADEFLSGAIREVARSLMRSRSVENRT